VIPGIVDELKLRGAFGQSGNQPKFGQKFIELTPGNVIGVPTFQLALNAGDPTIQPERQREIETGVDATLLRGRANLEVTLYEKKISDLLLQRSLQPSQGFRSLIFNGGVMRTRGLETQLRVIPIQTPSFQWSAQGNFSMTRCKIVSLRGREVLYPDHRAGHPSHRRQREPDDHRRRHAQVHHQPG
jgi:outer membrane cobalamin receptor